jgi:hypothetical protein
VHAAQRALWQAIDARREPLQLLRRYWAPSSAFWSFIAPAGDAVYFSSNPVASAVPVPHAHRACALH